MWSPCSCHSCNVTNTHTLLVALSPSPPRFPVVQVIHATQNSLLEYSWRLLGRISNGSISDEFPMRSTLGAQGGMHSSHRYLWERVVLDSPLFSFCTLLPPTESSCLLPRPADTSYVFSELSSWDIQPQPLSQGKWKSSQKFTYSFFFFLLYDWPGSWSLRGLQESKVHLPTYFEFFHFNLSFVWNIHCILLPWSRVQFYHMTYTLVSFCYHPSHSSSIHSKYLFHRL